MGIIWALAVMDIDQLWEGLGIAKSSWQVESVSDEQPWVHESLQGKSPGRGKCCVKGCTWDLKAPAAPVSKLGGFWRHRKGETEGTGGVDGCSRLIVRPGASRHSLREGLDSALSRWHVEGMLSSDGQPRGSRSWGGGRRRRGKTHPGGTRPAAAGGCLEWGAVPGAARAGGLWRRRLRASGGGPCGWGGWRPPPSAQTQYLEGRGGRGARGGEAGARRVSHCAPRGAERDIASRLGSAFHLQLQRPAAFPSR